MSNGGTYAPGWYADPMGRADHRWFDGTQWTDHVSSGGVQSSDPLNVASDAAADQRTVAESLMGTDSPEKVQRQVVERAGVDASGVAGGGTLFTEPVLVVNQKAKLMELVTEYAIFDAHGNQVGAVRQVGQSTAKKVFRALSSMDQFLTHKLQVVDHDGSVVLQLTRPAKVFKSRIVVENAQGTPVGEIVQENMIGKIHFGLHGAGGKVGAIHGENWRAWNFGVTDASGAEVARITKTWEGLAKTMFTTADNYVVQIHTGLPEPLRSLVVAAAVSVDLALKQDARGFG